MKIVIFADTFIPSRTSGAIQLRDLSLEMVRQGHMPTVMVPDSTLGENYRVEMWGDVRIVRLKAPKTKDINYARRTLGEFLMPFSMLRSLRRSTLRDERWEGVVWYSPTIFLGPIVKAVKKNSGCRSYLILRDIFPEWAVDMGLMGRGLPYRFFKAVEQYQYSVADVIGGQAPANLSYLDGWAKLPGRRVELLQNWLAAAPDVGCSISVASTRLAGRKIFVYAGNMGVAQGMGILLDLATALVQRRDVGFIFVGRGSDGPRLQTEAAARGLDNVAFFDEIDPSEIPGLYAQCHIGLVALDPRHKTHNIPGKFLSYMQSGLPVLASINPGNDLADLIEREQVGMATTDNSVEELKILAEHLVKHLDVDVEMKARCRNLAEKIFSPSAAVTQITRALAA